MRTGNNGLYINVMDLKTARNAEKIIVGPVPKIVRWAGLRAINRNEEQTPTMI